MHGWKIQNKIILFKLLYIQSGVKASVMANIILYISIQFCDDLIFAVFAYLLSQKLQHTEIISGIVCFRIFLNKKKNFLHK